MNPKPAGPCRGAGDRGPGVGTEWVLSVAVRFALRQTWVGAGCPPPCVRVGSGEAGEPSSLASSSAGWRVPVYLRRHPLPPRLPRGRRLSAWGPSGSDGGVTRARSLCPALRGLFPLCF